MMLYDVHDVCMSTCTCKPHKTLVSGLHEVSWVSTLLSVVGLKTCRINSNRVLKSSISRDCFHCSLFWFSHLTSDQNIPRKQPSMSVVSIINQFPALHRDRLLYPKIFPPIFFKVLTSITSNGSKSTQGLHSQPFSYFIYNFFRDYRQNSRA